VKDKDGGHTIRSAITTNPMLHVNLMAQCFIDAKLWWIKVFALWE